MDGFQKLHDTQDEFIKKTLQEDKIVTQKIFDNFSTHMDKTKVKVKKYTYKQQSIIFFLLVLLVLSVGLNIYLAVEKGTPITITNIFQPAKEYISNKNDEKNENINLENSSSITSNVSDNIANTTNSNTIKVDTIVSVSNTIVENSDSSPKNEISSDIVIIPETKEPEPIIAPEINIEEIKAFVDQFAIGINKLDLQDSENLESNTILLYIAQQYFSKQSNSSASLSVNTDFASSTVNFHKFLNEFTANDYSNVDYINSYNNYIGYISRSKAYVYGNDYSIISKEKYKCDNVTITNKENGIYTATANISRTYGDETNGYEIEFKFKINDKSKYQKYKLLSLNSKLVSGDIETIIHLVNQ